MAGRVKGFFHFETMQSTGIDTVPINRTIYVESEKAIYVKTGDSGLSSNSTINDALVANRIELLNAGQGAQGHESPRRDEVVGPEDYASSTIGGVVKMRLDISDPSKPKLFMTNDGTNP